MLPPRIFRASPARSAAKAEAKRAHLDRRHVDLVAEIGICAATGRICKTDPHHLMRDVVRGMSYKAAGRYTIPLSRKVHDEITATGDPEVALLERYGLLARELADALRAVSPDLDAMRRATRRAFQDAQGRLNRAKELAP